MSGRFDHVPLLGKVDDKDYFPRDSLRDPGEDVHDVFIREHLWRQRKCCRLVGLFASLILVLVAVGAVSYYMLFLQNTHQMTDPPPGGLQHASGTGTKTEEIIVEVTNNFSSDTAETPVSEVKETDMVGDTDIEAFEDSDDLYEFQYDYDDDNNEDDEEQEVSEMSDEAYSQDNSDAAPDSKSLDGTESEAFHGEYLNVKTSDSNENAQLDLTDREDQVNGATEDDSITDSTGELGIPEKTESNQGFKTEDRYYDNDQTNLGQIYSDEDSESLWKEKIDEKGYAWKTDDSNNPSEHLDNKETPVTRYGYPETESKDIPSGSLDNKELPRISYNGDVLSEHLDIQETPVKSIGYQETAIGDITSESAGSKETPVNGYGYPMSDSVVPSESLDVNKESPVARIGYGKMDTDTIPSKTSDDKQMSATGSEYQNTDDNDTPAGSVDSKDVPLNRYNYGDIPAKSIDSNNTPVSRYGGYEGVDEGIDSKNSEDLDESDNIQGSYRTEARDYYQGFDDTAVPNQRVDSRVQPAEVVAEDGYRTYNTDSEGGADWQDDLEDDLWSRVFQEDDSDDEEVATYNFGENDSYSPYYGNVLDSADRGETDSRSTK